MNSILIVEDDDVTFELLANELGKRPRLAKFELVRAETLGTAIRLVSEGPRLISTDMCYPRIVGGMIDGKAGARLIRIILDKEIKTPVVLCTNSTEQDAREILNGMKVPVDAVKGIFSKGFLSAWGDEIERTLVR